jgi:hypothetical protein
MGAAGRGGGSEKRRELRSSLPVGELMAFDMTATLTIARYTIRLGLSRNPESLPIAANAKISGHVIWSCLSSFFLSLQNDTIIYICSYVHLCILLLCSWIQKKEIWYIGL